MAEIYTITNTLTGEVYVGNTSRGAKKRWVEHLRDAKDNKRNRRKLYRAINEYGQLSFRLDIVEVCPSEISMERERYWINAFDSVEHGYNESYGGKGKNTANYRAILSIYDKTKSLKRAANESGVDVGTVKRALLDSCVPVPTRKESHDIYSKTILVSAKDGTLIRKFTSSQEAAEWISSNRGKIKQDIGSYRRHIIAVCKGKRKSAYGYIWSYEDLFT